MKNPMRSIPLAVIALLCFTAASPCHATQIVGSSGKCLDVFGGHTVNGTAVEIWPCAAGSPNQRWSLVNDTVLGIGGKCLDADGGHTANGTRVQMWDCKPGSPNQRWIFNNGQLIGTGDKCLDVAGGSTDKGTLVVLWDCHGGPNQTWSLLPSVIAP